MALAFEADEEYLASQVFQGGKKLLVLLYVATQVVCAVDDQQGGVYLLDIGYGGHAHVAFGIIPGRYLHVVVGEVPADVAAAEERIEVDHAAVCYCCFEAIRVPG